jgi:hypothetical protein
MKRRNMLRLIPLVLAGCSSSENGDNSDSTETVTTNMGEQPPDVSATASIVELPSPGNPLMIEFHLQNPTDHPIQLIPSGGTKPLARIPDLKSGSNRLVLYPPNNEWVTIAEKNEPQRFNNCWRFVDKDGVKLDKEIVSDGPRTILYSGYTIRHEVYQRELVSDCFGENKYSSELWLDAKKESSDSQESTRLNFEIVLYCDESKPTDVEISTI